MNLDEERLLQPAELVGFATEHLEHTLECLKHDVPRLVIPDSGSKRTRIENGHFHVKSELFLQLSGLTRFHCPGRHFTLYPQEICIMPGDVPHAEQVEDFRGNFYNLVFAVDRHSLSCHLAKRGQACHPTIFSIEHYTTVDTAKCLEALDTCVACYWEQSRYKDALLKAALLTLFARLLIILTEGNPSQLSNHPAISTCKKIILNNLGQSNLSTKYLADALQYSPAYMSFLFKEHTGENVLGYIRRKRFERARELLKTSSLNISEVAWACGFDDAGYFTRLFTRQFHMTPTRFRGLS